MANKENFGYMLLLKINILLLRPLFVLFEYPYELFKKRFLGNVRSTKVSFF